MGRFSPNTFYDCYYNNSKLSLSGARDRNRTGTPAMNEAADFKLSMQTRYTLRTRMGTRLLVVHTGYPFSSLDAKMT